MSSKISLDPPQPTSSRFLKPSTGVKVDALDRLAKAVADGNIDVGESKDLENDVSMRLLVAIQNELDLGLIGELLATGSGLSSGHLEELSNRPNSKQLVDFFESPENRTTLAHYLNDDKLSSREHDALNGLSPAVAHFVSGALYGHVATHNELGFFSRKGTNDQPVENVVEPRSVLALVAALNRVRTCETEPTYRFDLGAGLSVLDGNTLKLIIPIEQFQEGVCMTQFAGGRVVHLYSPQSLELKYGNNDYEIRNLVLQCTGGDPPIRADFVITQPLGIWDLFGPEHLLNRLKPFLSVDGTEANGLPARN